MNNFKDHIKFNLYPNIETLRTNWAPNVLYEMKERDLEKIAKLSMSIQCSVVTINALQADLVSNLDDMKECKDYLTFIDNLFRVIRCFESNVDKKEDITSLNLRIVPTISIVIEKILILSFYVCASTIVLIILSMGVAIIVSHIQELVSFAIIHIFPPAVYTLIGTLVGLVFNVSYKNDYFNTKKNQKKLIKKLQRKYSTRH